MIVSFGILLVCIGISAVSIRSVDRLRRDVLIEQAERWSAVSVLATAGELRMATAKLGASVNTGRHWKWRIPQGTQRAIASRDIRGILRTPARSLTALLGVLLAGGLLGAFMLNGGIAQAGLVGAATSLLTYTAIGPWCRGLRSAGEHAGSSPILPQSVGTLLMHHLITPGVLSVMTVTVAASIMGVMSGADPLRIAAAALIMSMIALLLRLVGALKGTLPMALLAPVPTEMGDMSAVFVTLWSLDGLIWATVIGAVLAALVSLSSAIAAIAAVVVLLGLMAWARSRLCVCAL